MKKEHLEGCTMNDVFIADFFHKPVTSLFCYHPGVQQTAAKGDDPNEQ